MPTLTLDQVKKLLPEVSGWTVTEDAKKISCIFKFKTFPEAIAFVHKVADIAEKENHHPDFQINYSKVTLTLWTHAIGGLSENDFIVAAKINQI